MMYYKKCLKLLCLLLTLLCAVTLPKGSNDFCKPKRNYYGFVYARGSQKLSEKIIDGYFLQIFAHIRTLQQQNNQDKK